MFTFFKEQIEKFYLKTSYKAVCYAEELIGSGNGKAKKEIAIDFMLSKLPVYLKPFTLIFRKYLNDIADVLIENAVKKLHTIQQAQKAKLENA